MTLNTKFLFCMIFGFYFTLRMCDINKIEVNEDYNRHCSYGYTAVKSLFRQIKIIVLS